MDVSEIYQTLIGEMPEDVLQDLLDDMVYECYLQSCSDLNNSGPEEQIQWLLENDWTAEQILNNLREQKENNPCWTDNSSLLLRDEEEEEGEEPDDEVIDES